MPLQLAFDETKAYNLAVRLSDTLDTITRRSFPKHRWDVFGRLDCYYVCLVGANEGGNKGYGVESELPKTSFKAFQRALAVACIMSDDNDISQLGPFAILSRSVSSPDKARPMVGNILTSHDSENVEVIQSQSLTEYRNAIEHLEENADKIRDELKHQLATVRSVENDFSFAANEDGLFTRLTRGVMTGLRKFAHRKQRLEK